MVVNSTIKGTILKQYSVLFAAHLWLTVSYKHHKVM